MLTPHPLYTHVFVLNPGDLGKTAKQQPWHCSTTKLLGIVAAGAAGGKVAGESDKG